MNFLIEANKNMSAWSLEHKGKYELRPAVKKLYQLCPKVTASSVLVASRG